MKTITYVIKRADCRCKAWAKKFTLDFCGKIDLADVNSLDAVNFLKFPADLELEEGDCFIKSEAKHHSKDRGYSVLIFLVFSGKLIDFPNSGIETKKIIKNLSTDEQWAQLKAGTGQVAAALRVAKAFAIFSDKQKIDFLSSAFHGVYSEESEEYEWIND